MRARSFSCRCRDPCPLSHARSCSGLSATCAGAHKKVRNGTPCRREGEEGAGLYTEVYGADGKLALFQAAEASTAALPAGKKGIDKHGSVTCDRCYQGAW